METVKHWLAELKHSETVETVTMDLWNPYRLSVREKLPNACIIADKYHVLRLANEIVETVRKSLRSSFSPSQAKQLKQDRKILLKRERDLTAHQRMILELWTGFVPVLSDLYQLKEEFFRIYDAACEQDAYARYLTWEQHIQPSLSEAFLSLQLTMEEWGEEVFGFFRPDVPLTNAFTERANLAICETHVSPLGYPIRPCVPSSSFHQQTPLDSRQHPNDFNRKSCLCADPFFSVFQPQAMFPVRVQHTISTYEIEEPKKLIANISSKSIQLVHDLLIESDYTCTPFVKNVTFSI